ncbi:MAG: TIGR01212 family radical SAM protein [Clostridia bacterium]|nr:TIGR01212 family radical SAM protein [Clostridia bacterium]
MYNPFPYSLDNKRYKTWNWFLQDKFGCKVSKIALNGGFTCPNIDGTRGRGGCTYCLSGSGEFAGNPKESVEKQFKTIAEKMEKKWKDTKYIPYFQANTNTYAPLSKLKELYEAALSLENTVGLAIATRPDSITDEVYEYLGEINKRTYLLVELGLQTIYDETGDRINRCHSYEEFEICYMRLKEMGINVCVHLILGLPGEDKEIMLGSVKKVASLKPDCIKLHLLHILKGTKIAEEYERGEFRCLELKEYVDIIVDALELLPPETTVQRLTGDGAKDSLIAPLWSLKKFVVLNEIDKEMVRRNTYQGKNYCQTGKKS